MKTELTIEESLKREKGMIFPSDMSERTLLAVSHSRNCIDALKKQIPQKVNEVYQARIVDIPGKCISAGDCPVCGSPVPTKHWYCWSCGQRIKWPET
nr:MAG TPA: PROTEIN/RNA Complex, archaeal, ribosomal, 50S, protein.0A [Caudoviricetes sp.]